MVGARDLGLKEAAVHLALAGAGGAWRGEGAVGVDVTQARGLVLEAFAGGVDAGAGQDDGDVGRRQTGVGDDRFGMVGGRLGELAIVDEEESGEAMSAVDGKGAICENQRLAIIALVVAGNRGARRQDGAGDGRQRGISRGQVAA